MLPVAARGAASVKAVKDFLFVGVGYPAPRILHLYAVFVAGTEKRKMNASARWRIGESVIHQNYNDLFDSLRVTHTATAFFRRFAKKGNSPLPRKENILFKNRIQNFF